MTGRALAALLLCLTVSAPLAAEEAAGGPEPINPDRPDSTNGPSLVEPHHLQLETGYTYTRSGSERTSALGEILLRYALDDRWEARLGLNSYDWIDSGVPGERRITGFEDPIVEVKIRLNETEAKNRPAGVPALGLLVRTTVPVGSRALTSDVWQPTAALALHWDLPADGSLESNLGYSYAADGDQRFDQFFASVSAGFQLNEKLGGFLEGYVFSKESADGSTAPFADTGLSYLISKDLSVDVRVGKGFEGPNPNWFTGLGAAFRW